MSRSPRRGWRGSAIGGLVAAGLVGAGLAGCPSSSPALPYTPYTGINFLSATIRQGVGCGTACGEVFKYVVVIGDPSDAAGPSLSPLPDGAPATFASLSSCYTDTVFASITSASDGGPNIEAWVYAYDQADFLAAQNAVPAFAACGGQTCPLSLADVQALVRTYSTYTTTCTATPESGDNVQASCLPLAASAPPDGGRAVGPDCDAGEMPAIPVGEAGADAAGSDASLDD